jgi:hypothetical protein
MLALPDIRKCEFSPAQMVTPSFSKAYRAAAAAGHFPYVSITSLFCTRAKCAIVVANHIVYLDGEHANRYYMDWVSTALGALIVKDL